jgi:hypothetical protein
MQYATAVSTANCIYIFQGQLTILRSAVEISHQVLGDKVIVQQLALEMPEHTNF